MRLILVRHGETEHNRRQLSLGRADVPLNARGLAQARAVAASFVRAPDAIFSSPLGRAVAMAEAVSERTGVAITIDDGLIEMDVGEVEHLAPAELRERHPSFIAQWMSDDAPDARMPGGETLREVQERAWSAVERIRTARPQGEVVTVTHNFVILTVACRALGLPLDRFRSLRVGLGTRTIIDITDQRTSVIEVSGAGHLMAYGMSDDSSERKARP